MIFGLGRIRSGRKWNAISQKSKKMHFALDSQMLGKTKAKIKKTHSSIVRPFISFISIHT